MSEMSFYILGGLGFVVAGIIWVRLLRDNAKQEQIIAKHSREITGIRNHRKTSHEQD